MGSLLYHFTEQLSWGSGSASWDVPEFPDTHVPSPIEVGGQLVTLAWGKGGRFYLAGERQARQIRVEPGAQIGFTRQPNVPVHWLHATDEGVSALEAVEIPVSLSAGSALIAVHPPSVKTQVKPALLYIFAGGGKKPALEPRALSTEEFWRGPFGCWAAGTDALSSTGPGDEPPDACGRQALEKAAAELGFAFVNRRRRR